MSVQSPQRWTKVLSVYLIFLLLSILFIKFASTLETGHLKRVITAGVNDGSLPAENYSKVGFQKFTLATTDNYSDCIEIAHGLSKSEFSFSTRPTTNQITELPCASLGIKSDSEIGYGRFFHGSAALVKVIVNITGLGIKDIELLTSLLLNVSMAFITFLLFRQKRILGITTGIYFFAISDIPFQGLSLTHGIPTALALSTTIVAVWVARHSETQFYLLAAVSGGLYAIFAQLYTPLLFAAFAAYIPQILNRSPKGYYTPSFETNKTKTFVYWTLGYLLANVARLIWGALTLGSEIYREFQVGAETRVTSDLYLLFRTVYLHLIYYPSQYPLKVLGVYLFILFVGLQLGKQRFDFTGIWKMRGVLLVSPLSFSIAWYLLMGGHNGHAWVGNFFWAFPLFLLYEVYLSRKPVERQ